MTDEIPPPAIRTSELWGRNAPFALLPSARHSVGWLQASDDTTIPLEERARLVTIRRSAMGTYKVVSTYPLTKDGWQQACRELAALEPSAMPMLRKLVAQRLEEDQARAAEVPTDGADRQWEGAGLTPVAAVARAGARRAGYSLNGRCESGTPFQ